jgi:hypothetical protein
VCSQRRCCDWRIGSVTWLLLRKLKTFFDQKGSALLSVGEQKLRERMNADAALYETGVVKDEAGNDVAYVRCTNVKRQLLSALAAHRERGQLQQFGRLSGSELRATVLGDKGGAYTKLLLTVWDVVDSQSPKNCILLGMYRGDESYSVISSAFGPVMQQLASLTAETELNVLPSAVPSAAPTAAVAAPTAVAASARIMSRRERRFQRRREHRQKWRRERTRRKEQSKRRKASTILPILSRARTVTHSCCLCPFLRSDW